MALNPNQTTPEMTTMTRLEAARPASLNMWPLSLSRATIIFGHPLWGRNSVVLLIPTGPPRCSNSIRVCQPGVALGDQEQGYRALYDMVVLPF